MRDCGGENDAVWRELYVVPRRFEVRLRRVFATDSTLEFFNSAPRENRTLCRAAAPGFIEAMTWEGSGESARQAEPLLAQMPAWSSSRRRASDSMPWKVMLLVLGRRWVGWPFNSVSGMDARMLISNASRSGRRFAS